MQFLVALGASFKYFFSFSPLCLFGEGVSREMFTEMFFEAHPPKVGRGERERFFDVNFERSPYLIIRLLDYTPESEKHTKHK